LIGKKVEVQKHFSKVLVYKENKLMTEHKREMVNGDKRITDKSHRSPRLKKEAASSPSKEEKKLVGESPILDRYVTELKKRSHGRGMVKFRKLLELKRTYPGEAFINGVEKALHYGMYDLVRLEKIILSFIAGEYFKL